MPKVIEAVYENGVIKPLERVEIREGEKLIVRIEKTLEIEKLRGKYGNQKKMDKKILQALEDEVYDRRSHFC